MAQYSVLNDTALQAILTQYSVGGLLSYKVLSGGSENTNFFIKTQNSEFVLTICEQKSVQEADELASLLDHLRFYNFNTSKLVRTTKGALTVVWNDKPVMLKEFIVGDILEDLPNNLLIYLGSELAKLHQIKAPDYLPESLNYGLEHFDKVQVYARDSSFYIWLKRTQNYIENSISLDLPRSLIHSDIFYSNIIVAQNGEQATIMDFEEACYYYRVFDIGMMLIGTCCDEEILNQEKATNLLKGYQQETPILEIEKNALQAFTVYAASATAFWRHQNFNYVQVDESMSNHYVAMKNLADYVAKISPETFRNFIVDL